MSNVLRESIRFPQHNFAVGALYHIPNFWLRFLFRPTIDFYRTTIEIEDLH